MVTDKAEPHSGGRVSRDSVRWPSWAAWVGEGGRPGQISGRNKNSMIR